MPEPQIPVVVFHTVENDLASIPAGTLCHRLTEPAMLVPKSLPNTMVIWSDMFPRLSFRGGKG